jgi:hypothetical protein
VPNFIYSAITGDGDESMINYLALGPEHQVKVAPFTIPDSTGTEAITGVGFQPDLVLVCGTVTNNVNEGFEGLFMHLGVATATDQWCMSVWAPDNSSPPDRTRRWHDSKFIAQLNGAANDFEAALDSFDADGFTIDVTDAPGVPLAALYIAIRGGTYAAGVESVPAATGIQTISVGFDPDAMLFGSGTQTAPGIDDHIRWAFGGADDTRQHSISSSADKTSQNTASWQSPTTCITMTETPTGASNLLAQAEMSDMHAGGGDVEIDWTTVDGNAYEYGWLAFSDAAVDRFEFDNTASQKVEPSVIVPTGFIGFNLMLPDTDDDAGGVGGMHFGFSGAGSDVTDFEGSCSWWDADSPALSVQQNGRRFMSGVFGTGEQNQGGLGGTGTGAQVHRCDIVQLGRRQMPQIYRHDLP